MEPELREARMWAMICHLCGLLAYTAIPFAGVLGPLVVWMIKKEEFEFVNDQGKEAINFQISISLYILICIVLAFILIGFALMFVVGIFQLIFTIVAAIKANDGVRYRYPLTIRFIK